ncbi:hypothetical protein ACJ73_05454 [Blastomyces percursus]|uniref:Dienelactone hydrolase domain-containing protein n=1 Tax=Blastomyces percursus TaxID=1658174 RepID=A0A1J9R6E3_9EURO|nr:hypothetical protein ACJ73_05454 [Blastomyces percursus]
MGRYTNQLGWVGKLGNNDAYITGDNPDVAVMLIHDLIGWTFPNLRILADHYAREANVAVYLPDFFGGVILSVENVIVNRFDLLDLPNFVKQNGRDMREPEIFECARDLRQTYKKVGAIGFCYGGWAVFRLGAKEHHPPLVDCIVPDIDEVAVPVQVLAPENRSHVSTRTQNKLGLPLDYLHFPGVEHGCFVRGDDRHQEERDAMTRAKNAAVGWFKQCLFDS